MGLISRKQLTSIEDVSLVDPPNHRLLPGIFVDLHQACPRGVVASFPAYSEFVYVCVRALAHSALKTSEDEQEEKEQYH